MQEYKNVHELVKFKKGDKVRLHRGKVGKVLFIGKTAFSKGVVVGMELDSWFEKGNDGVVNGKRYFNVRGPGWGYFTKPSAIAEVLDSYNFKDISTSDII